MVQAPNVSEGWSKKARIVAIIGNFIRYYDFETIIKPYSERLLKLM